MKKYSKIVLAGGSGYLGTVLAEHFAEQAEELIILSRTPKTAEGNISTMVWDAKTPGNWTTTLNDADLLINLCGKNVNCRYTKKNKAGIFASRLEPTDLLHRVVAGMPYPPKVWINITSATIYRHAEDRPQDEVTGQFGDGFSVAVCRTWEKTFFQAEIPGVRKIALRMGIVLGGADSIFPRLRNLVKFGLGGKQGNGRQMVSWVHEQDVAQICGWLTEHPETSGVINCVAPVPVSNSKLMKTIRRVMRVPFGLPCPAWLLTIGAFFIGTETELVLKSRWVLPSRLLDAGYKFTYPEIDGAVEAIVL